MDKNGSQEGNDPNGLSPIREEDENSSLANQSLQQIDEEDEPSFFENSDEVENLNLSGTACPSAKTDEVLLATNMAESTHNSKGPINISADSSIVDNKSSLKNHPSTPPEILRERFTFCQRELENLKYEHEELREFTILEKQTNHENCISRDKVENLNDELTFVNQKVDHLMKENLYCKKELVEKQQEIRNLKITLLENKRDAKDVIIPMLFQSGIKVENLPEEVKNISFLKDILENHNFDTKHTNGSNISTQPASYFEEELISVLSGMTLFVETFDETKIQDDNFKSSNLFHSTESTVFSSNAQTCILQVKECVELKLINCYNTINQLNLTLSELRNEITHYKAETKDLKRSIKSLNETFVVMQNCFSNLDKGNMNLLDKSSKLAEYTQKFNLSLGDLKKEDISLENENESLLGTTIKDFIPRKEDNGNLDSGNQIKSSITEVQVTSVIKPPKQDLENDNYSLKSIDYNKLELKQYSTVLKKQIFTDINKDITKVLVCLEATVDSGSGCREPQEIADTIREFVNEVRHTIPYIDVSVEERIISIFSKFQRLLMNEKETNKSIKEKFDKIMTENSLLLMSIISIRNEIVQSEFANDLLSTTAKELTNDNRILLDQLKEAQRKSLNDLELYQNKVKLAEMENNDLLTKTAKLENDLQDTMYLLESKGDDFSKLQNHFENLSKDFPKDIAITLQSQNLSNELDILRNSMISEIVNLDIDESEEYLTNSTSEELFNKLMQIIIRTEGEVSANQEKMFKYDTDQLHESNESLKNTLNSQKSWIQELENENERISKELVQLNGTVKEFQGKIKTLTCTLQSAMFQVSMLKSDNLKLTTDNDILKAELNNLKKMNEKESAHQSKHKVDRDDNFLQATNLNFKCAHSCKKCSNNDQQVCQPLIESRVGEDTNLIIDSNINDCSSHFDFFKGSAYENNKTDENFINNFDQEKSNFINVLNSINVEYNEITLTRCESFVFLNEIVELVQDKLCLIQNHFTSKLKKLQSDFDIRTSELSNIKIIIDNIYQDALANNEKLIHCFPDIGDGFLMSGVPTLMACGDLNILGQIDLMKDDCLIISDITTSFKTILNKGQYLIKELSQHMATIQHLVFQKDEQISNFNQSIENERKLSEIRERKINETEKEEKRKLSEIRERKINEIEKEETRLKDILAYNEKQLKDKDRDISKLKSILTLLDDGLLNTYTDLNETTELVQRKVALYDQLAEDCNFFSTQCKLMMDHILHLETEFEHLNLCVKESNMFLSHIKKYALFFKAQCTELTIHETLDIVIQIFSEYSCLKEDQAKYLKDLKSNQDGLLKTQEELKSLQKINSNLTFEINSSQDAIRNLRSEIRRLRIQDRKKSNENTFDVKKERKNLGVQTEYSSYDQEIIIAELKESLHKSNSRITTLEIQIQNEDLPNLKRAKLCDVSLTQAKDRIKNLQMLLMEQKRYNQELTQQIKMLKTYSDTSTSVDKSSSLPDPI